MTLELERSAIQRTLSLLSEVRNQLTTAQLDLISAKVNGNSDSWDEVLFQTADDIATIQKHLERLADPLWQTLKSPLLPARPPRQLTPPPPAQPQASLPIGAQSVPCQVMSSQFLGRLAQNLRIEVVPTPISQREWELRRVAMAITENQQNLRLFMQAIRDRLAHGQLDIDIRPNSPDGALHANLLARRLKAEGLISKLVTRRFPEPISFYVTEDPEQQRWLQGRWLEVSAYLIAQDEIARWEGDNPNRQLHSGVVIKHASLHREIDLVGQLPNSELFWAECKTGQWQQFVGRAKEIRDLLGTPISHSLLIVPWITQRDWDAYRSGPQDFLLLTPADFRVWIKDHL